MKKNIEESKAVLSEKMNQSERESISYISYEYALKILTPREIEVLDLVERGYLNKGMINIKYISLILFIVTFCGCDSQEAQRIATENLYADIQISPIHEWIIQLPEAVPNPRFSGVLSDTNLVLVDRSLHTINLFDNTGKLIKKLGGTGRGPGEFSEITYATINPDGKVAVADNNNARFTIINLLKDSLIIEPYDIGWHTRLFWTSDHLIISNNPFKEGADHPGDVFIRSFDPSSGEKDHVFHLELEWGDHISEEQISCTFCEHRFMNDKSFFTSPQDTSYRIYKVNPTTDETILFTRIGIPAVKYTEDEREELKHQRRSAHQITGLNLDNDNIPTHKQRFIDFFPDTKGRLWTLLNPTEGEPPTFDIFSYDAEYIGSIHAPDRVQNVQFVPDKYILFNFESDDPDVWKGTLYQIID